MVTECVEGRTFSLGWNQVFCMRIICYGVLAAISLADVFDFREDRHKDLPSSLAQYRVERRNSSNRIANSLFEVCQVFLQRKNLCIDFALATAGGTLKHAPQGKSSVTALSIVCAHPDQMMKQMIEVYRGVPLDVHFLSGVPLNPCLASSTTPDKMMHQPRHLDYLSAPIREFTAYLRTNLQRPDQVSFCERMCQLHFHDGATIELNPEQTNRSPSPSMSVASSLSSMTSATGTTASSRTSSSSRGSTGSVHNFGHSQSPGSAAEDDRHSTHRKRARPHFKLVP